MEPSKALFLFICSFHKQEGGTVDYAAGDSVLGRLPRATGEALLGKREQVRLWLIEGEQRWRYQRIGDMELNRFLVRGEDFGGRDHSAQYLPALERYNGRFYMALGEQGRAMLQGSRHHALIVSGLYGVVTPMEPIQLYSAPLASTFPNFRAWTTGSETLTSITSRYVRHHRIERVLDLTANGLYRSLIDWGALGQQMGNVRGSVLHCFSKMAAGDDALTHLAELTQALLSGSPDPLSLPHDEPTEVERQPVIFSTQPTPPDGWPREGPGTLLDPFDLVGRAYRGVVAFLDKLEGTGGEQGEDLCERIDRLHARAASDRLAATEGYAMHLIRRKRNKAVHEGSLPTGGLSEIRNACERLQQCAMERWGMGLPELDIPWDEAGGSA